MTSPLRPLPLVALALAGLLLASCSGPAPATTAPSSPATTQPSPAAAAPPAPMKGVSLSPRSFQSEDFREFFEQAGRVGQVVAWAGAWDELGAQTGGPHVVMELARVYGFTPVVEAQFFTQSTGALLRPLDAATIGEYVRSAAAFAARYKPPYLGLGIEVNVLHSKSPADFERFVSLFDEAGRAVKAASPGTVVFTVFQLEQMKGLNGGLFGGSNDPSRRQWQLLGLFPGADMFAFTTYPGLVYRDPDQVPADYYSEVEMRTSKPFAFTEVGWHSAPFPQGWESSEAEQADFVRRFSALTSGLGHRMAVWSFLYDQKVVPPFDSMGLRRADGSARPSWDEWAALE